MSQDAANQVAVIGERPLVEAFGLAGAHVLAAESAAAVRAAWEALSDDVGLVVLTKAAAAALVASDGPEPDGLTPRLQTQRLVVVMG
jgi:hypothetical protein